MLMPTLVMGTAGPGPGKGGGSLDMLFGKANRLQLLKKRLRPSPLHIVVAFICLITVFKWVAHECAAYKKQYYETLVDAMLMFVPHGPLHDNEKFLVFTVDEGLTNQRIGIVSGLLIASLMGRTAVLPKLKTSYHPEAGQEVLFDAMYDSAATMAGLAGIVRVTTHGDFTDWMARKAAPTVQQISVQDRQLSPRWYSQLGTMTKADIVVLDKTFAALSIADRPAVIRRWWDIDQALVPAQKWKEAAMTLHSQLVAMSSTGRYSALHLRVEDDWVEHCKSWLGGDHCMTNTQVIYNTLEIEGVPRDEPLFLASGLSWNRLKELKYIQELRKRYKVVTKDMLVPSVYSRYDVLEERECLAEIDFIVCSKASTFIGNSVSTFSALVMLRREHESGYQRGQHTIAYNGGPIPLVDHIPNSPHRESLQKPLKWVFALTGSSESGNGHYERMAKVAVLSALNHTTLQPVCIYRGNESELTAWLREKGVPVIFHEPLWEEKLRLPDDVRARNQKNGHLFGKHSSMVGTFLRLDIPIIGFTDQYVLYTDVDVFFRAEVNLDDFSGSLGQRPRYFSVGPEFSGEVPAEGPSFGNAGVMLLNIPGMRATYEKFLDFTFSADNIRRGFDFKEMGPGDQGAYNSFYQGKFNVVPWPVFNWKPYWQYNDGAKIVHFHGPKPHEYHDYKNGSPSSPLFQPILDLCNFEDWLNGCRQWLNEYDSYVSSCSIE